MTLKIRIHKHELGLWFRHGDFRGVLEPGTFYMIGLALGYDRIQVVDTLTTRFNHRKLEALVREEQLRKYLQVVDLDDEQRALVWKDGRLAEILGPGRHAFWKSPAEIVVETFDSKNLRIEHDKLDVILRDPQAPSLIHLSGLPVVSRISPKGAKASCVSGSRSSVRITDPVLADAVRRCARPVCRPLQTRWRGRSRAGVGRL